jgi:hypothetical protein
MSGGMSNPSSRQFPTSTERPLSTSRDEMLDDTIESSFPASDPPSSIPDPEPEPEAFALAVERSRAQSPIFWAALGAVALSAVWLGLTWQRGRLG